MILRHVVSWGVRARAWACWGVPRSTQITPTARLLSPWCSGSRGVLGCIVGGRESPPQHLHTASTTCTTAFTWSRRRRRRRRRRKEELGFLSTSFSSISTDSSESRGEEEVKDDEAQQLVPMEMNRGGEGLGAMQGNVGEAVIYELQRLFAIPEERAVRMVGTDNFLLVSDKAILKTLYFLKEHQVSSEQLQRIPWLLLQSSDELQQKFHKLRGAHLFLSLPDGLGFCFFPYQTIVKLQHKFSREAHHFPHHHNRVYYLAHRLQMPVPLVTEKTVKPKQVLSIDIKKIDIVLDIFQKYNVPMKSVLSDLWVFYHNLEIIEDRLRQATEAGCPNPKPWICHAALPIFERYLTRVRARYMVLGKHGTLDNYLSERLQCPLHEIQAAFRRNEGLANIHVGHMKSKLDLILGAGFTTEDVRGCMRVLQYSVKRTRSRIEEMSSLGLHHFSISALFKQPKTYANIVRRVKRDRLRKESGGGKGGWVSGEEEGRKVKERREKEKG
ncbi:uncharacterized protein LOC123502139 isoform X2 [Portunus trituberculatus]|uniref:uncharacterized protein LOC123502139 isoform X2 n=1 Tax=Portunus trituberculatus TaxID=210409 RepID=UPI001E1CB1D5|nr:uncharacterized protein LOC123502139 isoform X2 [Portunus trituberculatus]